MAQSTEMYRKLDIIDRQATKLEGIAHEIKILVNASMERGHNQPREKMIEADLDTLSDSINCMRKELEELRRIRRFETGQI